MYISHWDVLEDSKRKETVGDFITVEDAFPFCVYSGAQWTSYYLKL